MLEITGYLSLFLTAFIAATLIPTGSEAVLVGLVLADHFVVWGLLLAATTGNVLGSVVNWWMGMYVDRFHGHRWFPASPAQMIRARYYYQRYGRWSLLLSWMPIIGDPITLVAGVLREPLWRFLLLVILAKFGRYFVLVMLTLGWLD
jgi:membrane protein YqaA with SNARE-associated domain